VHATGVMMPNAVDDKRAGQRRQPAYCEVWQCMASVNLTHLAPSPKTTALCEITRNSGHWVVRGHSKSQGHRLWYRSKSRTQMAEDRTEWHR